MAKRKTIEESIKEIYPLYAEGRSQKQLEAFLAKDVKHQYLSLKAWERRNVTKTEGGESPASKPEVESTTVASSTSNPLVKMLRKVRRAIENGTELNDREISRIGRELNYMREALTNYSRLRTEQEIEKLRRESERIAKRMETLRQSLD